MSCDERSSPIFAKEADRSFSVLTNQHINRWCAVLWQVLLERPEDAIATRFKTFLTNSFILLATTLAEQQSLPNCKKAFPFIPSRNSVENCVAVNQIRERCRFILDPERTFTPDRSISNDFKICIRIYEFSKLWTEDFNFSNFGLRVDVLCQ